MIAPVGVMGAGFQEKPQTHSIMIPQDAEELGIVVALATGRNLRWAAISLLDSDLEARWGAACPGLLNWPLLMTDIAMCPLRPASLLVTNVSSNHRVLVMF